METDAPYETRIGCHRQVWKVLSSLLKRWRQIDPGMFDPGLPVLRLSRSASFALGSLQAYARDLPGQLDGWLAAAEAAAVGSGEDPFLELYAETYGLIMVVLPSMRADCYTCLPFLHSLRWNLRFFAHDWRVWGVGPKAGEWDGTREAPVPPERPRSGSAPRARRQALEAMIRAAVPTVAEHAPLLAKALAAMEATCRRAVEVIDELASGDGIGMEYECLPRVIGLLHDIEVTLLELTLQSSAIDRELTLLLYSVDEAARTETEDEASS